jgi:signal transduction histidine kinase
VPAQAIRTVAAGKNAAYVRIRVSDTGVGIPAQNINRLFEPFFTTKHNGTGLGLPITRRIVQEHFGEIAVQSEPDRGTTFSVVLPTSSLHASSAERNDAPRRPIQRPAARDGKTKVPASGLGL